MSNKELFVSDLFYEVPKAFCCEIHVVQKHEMFYQKKWFFLYSYSVHTSEWNPNSQWIKWECCYCLFQNWNLTSHLSLLSQEFQQILFFFFITPNLFIVYSHYFTNSSSSRTKSISLKTHFEFSLRTRPKKKLVILLLSFITWSF